MKVNSAGERDDNTQRVVYLIIGYISKTLTVQEHDELDAWVEESDENMKLFEELTDEKNIEANLEWMSKVRTEQMLLAAKQNVKFESWPGKLTSIRWIVAIAASILLLLSIVVVYKLAITKKETGVTLPVAIKTDIQPGGNKAVLTLSNGAKIDLTNAEVGLLKNDNGVLIKKESDGQIIYSTAEEDLKNQVGYNVLTVPKGGQYKITLPDGSLVWLNAASSLKYPTYFNSLTRTVELTGEGYFEVAKNIKQPFKVIIAPHTEVKVLGTYFNIMAYDEEKLNAVTLIEGSVEVHSKTGLTKLNPGQQAQITAQDFKVLSGVDEEEVIGWKSGEFVFNNADIKAVMRQIERWYNVEVKYTADVKQHFNATISRNEPVSGLLNLFEKTGHVHFKIENQTIYVLP